MSKEYLLESTKSWIIEHNAIYVITEQSAYYTEEAKVWDKVTLTVLAQIIKAQKINLELMSQMNTNILIAAFQELERCIIKSDGQVFGKKEIRASRFERDNAQAIKFATKIVELLEEKDLSIPWKNYALLLDEVCTHFGSPLTKNHIERARILKSGCINSGYLPRLKKEGMVDWESFAQGVTPYAIKHQMLWLRDAKYKDCTFTPDLSLTDPIRDRAIKLLTEK